jgi:hypothetical protein
MPDDDATRQSAQHLIAEAAARTESLRATVQQTRKLVEESRRLLGSDQPLVLPGSQPPPDPAPD